MTLQDAHRRTAESGVDLDEQRPCHLYRIFTWDHDAWMRGELVRVLGYIGESSREPLDRLLEHLNGARSDGPKPWGDLVAGWEIDPTVYGCKRDVLAAEEAAVLAERPLYNIEYQKGAPHYVPKWVQEEQRQIRDRRRRASGNDRAAQPRRRSAPKATTGPQPVRVPASARRSRRKMVIRGLIWALLSALASVPAVAYVPLPTWRSVPPVALLVAALLTATAPDWRAGSGWRRSRCEFWAWVLVAAAVAALVLPSVAGVMLHAAKAA